MKLATPPLRFLALVLGGWAVFRVAALGPTWWETEPVVASPPRDAEVAIAPPGFVPPPVPDLLDNEGTPVVRAATAAALQRGLAPHAYPWRFPTFGTRRATARSFAGATRPAQAAPNSLRFDHIANPSPETALSPGERFLPGPPPRSTRSTAPNRWAGSAWLFVRAEQGSAGLAPGGTLGGSQAGARLTYRIGTSTTRPLALSARVYTPLDRPQAAEVAVGVDWRPIGRLPVHLLAERRQGIGREGRSDFSVTIYGGTEQRVGPVRVEAYGQTGVVGHRDPEPFADGAARATIRVGPLDVGGGVWGGAQRGVARLDMGPHFSARLPIGGVAVRASAEWRFRIAGDAEPASGPAITLATDF